MTSKFCWRAFISFALVWTFLVIFVSGFVLYIAPPGRYANFENWKFAGFSKSGWQALHIIFSLVFVVLSLFHLFAVNWKVFLSYVNKKMAKGFRKKKELIVASVIVFLFFLGTTFRLQPFQTVIYWGELAKHSWEQSDSRDHVAPADGGYVKKGKGYRRYKNFSNDY